MLLSQLKANSSPYGPIYSLGLIELETLKVYIKTHLKIGFIWPSEFLVGAPIILDKQSDSSLYLYIDYQDLNNLTIKNWYPLPLIGKFLDRLGCAKQFTQLDLTNIYYWMRIQEGDNQKTMFRIEYSHFKYQVMLFGLSNTPASFQGYINKILAKKLDIFIIIYLDNILVYTKNPDQPHVTAIRQVLEQLWKHSLFAN